jgi:putative phosphonoacetaldehyde dehydrogenase
MTSTAARPAPAAAEIEVVNPYTGDVVGSAPRLGAEEVEAAAARAKAGREPLPAERRAAILAAAAAELRARRDEFALLITRESGVCVKESAREVDRAAGNLAVAAEEAQRIHGEALPIASPRGRRLAITLREPVGVVAAITPFNRPLNQVAVKVAPALAAGNSVVVKPSEKTPLTALAFAALLTDCGLPQETVQVVTGEPREIGPVLAGSAAVDMVTFTGSVAVGQAVARAAAGKRVTLELGGNDPLIVLEDADLDAAAGLVAQQAFATAGQSCRGIKRIICIEGVADELVDAIVARTRTVGWGDPFDPATDIGPLIDAAAAERVEERCERACADGARLVWGGERRDALFAPTVLDHVPAGTPLVAEETFGPVAPVIRVSDDAAAIAVANSTDYGLQAGVVTDSFARFMRIAEGLEVGAVNLMEGPALDSPHIPFGGVKRSGIGREGIRWAIEEMTTVKTLTLPRARV